MDAPADLLRRAALRYAEGGWGVIPLHTPVDGVCDCRKKADCESPGKHPWTRNGLSEATTDLAKVDAWWREHPTANIGLVLPRDIVAVDIDSPDALDGFEAHPDWELPETWNVTTGRGWHYIYRTEHPVKGTTGILEGVDLRGYGNYLVAPPSLHQSGVKYRQNSSMSFIAPAPAWVTNGHAAEPIGEPQDGPIPAGKRNSTLATIAGAMRRHGSSEDVILAALRAENQTRVRPMLEDDELVTIAHSVARYAPEGEPITLRVVGDSSEPLKIENLANFSTDPPPPMLVDRLDPKGHTILYGAGGVGKGTYASWLALKLTRTGDRVLLLDYEHHPEEWSRRVYGLGGKDDMELVRYVAPLSAYWSGQRGPLWKSAEEIRHICDSEGITVCLIDSLAIACAGADVSDPGTPALYAAGLEMIERPVLSLAHVNRAGDMAYPFGSAFWHNLARVTWSLEADGVRSILSPRKSNNYLRSAKLSIEVTWDDGLPREVSERPYGDTIADRAWEVLGPDSMTAKQITAAINEEGEEGDKAVKEDSVRAALRRASGLDARFKKVGETWSRVA
jgi:hypothetical protein